MFDIPRYTSRIVLIEGVLVTLLGIAHLIVGLTLEPARIEGLGPQWLLLDYISWFQAFGACIVLMGLLDLACVQELQQGSPLAWRISFLSSLFALVFGLVGTLAFRLSPPNVLLLAGGAGLAALTSSRSAYQSPDQRPLPAQ